MEIENIKKVLAMPLGLHMAYDKANADGKIDVNDMGYLMDPMMKLVPAITGAKAALAEIKDLDETERAELNTWANATYDIGDDVLEVKIEGAIDVMFSIAKFVGLMTAADAPVA